MADQLVAATIGVLLDKAVSVAADKINVVLGFRKDLEAMQEHAKDIQAVLADAETKQSRNPIVLSWLHKVEAASFEAENVLDELLYESLRREVESRDKAKKAAKVCLFFSLSKHDLSFRWRMSSKVREINGKFEKFKLEALEIGLISMVDSMAKAEVVIAGRETNSLPLQFVAGRDKEVSEIVGKLLSASASVSVISIVGMGGLGKTTLAKSVYNNTQIDNHFGRKIWVCVSDKFEVTELFRLILESLIEKKVEESSQDGIVRKIQEKLGGKRFLLVLDDVWNEEQKLWDAFFTSLVGLNTASGSCCLVTTRLQKTAKLVSTVDPYVLDKLADDECWYIICRRATKDGEMPEQPNAHRDQILKRCQGLPLAANAVGGLLSLQRREEWLSIVEDKILKVSDYVEGEITPILRLSFDNLPSLSIKKCFAYCSIYPKHKKMRGMELIQLWMAEGFLQKAFVQEGVESRTVMEEIGEDHLTVLLQSSLLERVDEDSYQMHDLVHDVAQSVSEREQIDGEVRHLALASDFTEYNARSTLVRMVKGEISDKVLLKFQRLRVLNLRGMETENLPSTIGKAKHLRYLDISDFGIKVVPDSLCKLYNLQTLKLPDKLQCLPPGFSNLISLRHLHFDQMDMKMAPNMGRLTCLQTLKFFNVGGEDGYEIKELGSMKNLAGIIGISNLELVKGKEGARLANLFEKKKLVTLGLCWGFTDSGDNGNRNDEHVLEGLEPHPNLQQLWLRDYMGARLPQWLGQLKALTTLIFCNCKTFKDVPTLGHLPYLERLEILGSDGVTCIGESFYVFPSMGGLAAEVFPSLKTMELMKLPNLREWKGLEAANGHVFPKLETLIIHHCCQLASVPSPFPSLKNLDIRGDIQVSVVREIIGKSRSLLKTLWIQSMGGLNSLAHVIENHLTCLEHLTISDCDNLMDISTIEFCASLGSLHVSGCPKLMPCALNLQRIPSLSSLKLRSPTMFSTNVMPTGFRYLTNLRDLTLGPFTDDSIQSFDWSGLIACSSTLNELRWDGSLQKHSGLPQQLQYLTSLQRLQLDSLNSIEALPDWLGNLTSITDLQVYHFPLLRCLPSADSMRRLTNLRGLTIWDCPLLTESSIQEISTTLPNLKISRE